MAFLSVDETKLAAELYQRILLLLDGKPLPEVAGEAGATALGKVLDRGVEVSGTIGSTQFALTVKSCSQKENTP